MPRPRTKRIDRLQGLLHPTVRFWWGLGLLGCLVFAGDWQPRVALALAGALLAVLSGKRVSFGYFGFLVASVVVFHLFLPVGRVWLQLGPWAITEGAFFLGLGKGATFAGLVFFSLASIHRDLQLPGRFGAVWAKTFSWYEQLMDQRGALKPRALLLSMDQLLERLYPTRPGRTGAPTAAKAAPGPTQPLGWVLVVVSLAVGLAVCGWWR